MKSSLGLSLFLVLGILLSASPPAAARDLTFEQRVKAQEAIEHVYWSHRIWPIENVQPRPLLPEVMPLGAIRAKVRSYLEKSDAVAERWSRPITSEQLEAEVERMRRNSRNPQVLQEIFAALGKDPFLIAECLARPALAERLFRNWSSQGAPSLSASERLADPAARSDPALNHSQTPGEENRLDRRNEAKEETRLGEWDKSGEEARPDQSSEHVAEFAQSERVSLEEGLTRANSSSGLCTQDTWSAMAFGVADPRVNHAAVWTGSEMIVWGGDRDYRMNNGGRYDPATDTWTSMSRGPNVPVARTLPKAVWTGTEMIVWGGAGGGNSGGRYNPTTDVWTATSMQNVPVGRRYHTMIWTGSEVIVWGGNEDGSSALLRTGGRYNPSTDTWTRTSTVNAPAERDRHTAVWTGSRMIVWGGQGNNALNTGGLYDPATDSWMPTSMVGNVPPPRLGPVSVWTGHEMLIWGGRNGSTYPNDIGLYDPLHNFWSLITLPNAPSGRIDTTAVWTGREMIVWGGSSSNGNGVQTGGRYDPQQNIWRTTSIAGNAPAGRFGHTAVWSGSEMIVWGGQTASGSASNVVFSGGRYDPLTDTWVPTSTGVLDPRSAHSAVWTGSEMIVWGGGLITGGIYDPATDLWRALTTANAPTSRFSQSTVWTGTEMIVWGGSISTYTTPFNTGARYNPLTDSWTATKADASAPLPRRGHSAIWTGRRMIVWGGQLGAQGAPSQVSNTGGQYDPQNDTWTPTATAGAPQARASHTAVWLKGKMIVWGGSSLNTGGTYDPLTDTWQATSPIDAPSPRSSHQAIVTGDDEMIVWGGTLYGTPLNTGGRYSLSADKWLSTSTGANVPQARYGHTAVWTGKEMIIWGGEWTSNTGGRYAPSTDTWTPTPTGPETPDAHNGHTAVWTGAEMLVWGGSPLTSTGGRYCACPEGRLAYRDTDADGFGNPRVSIPSCDGSTPSGYTENALDCDDADPMVHPKGVELCDGIDDDCDGTVDNAGRVTGLVIESVSTGQAGPFDRRVTGTRLDWNVVAGAQGYDVISGGLMDLTGSAGDFSVSVDTCLADHIGPTTIDDPRLPGSGEGFFYLIRAVGCGGAGSYDEPGQIRSRDPGVLASPSECPERSFSQTLKQVARQSGSLETSLLNRRTMMW